MKAAEAVEVEFENGGAAGEGKYRSNTAVLYLHSNHYHSALDQLSIWEKYTYSLVLYLQ